MNRLISLFVVAATLAGAAAQNTTQPTPARPEERPSRSSEKVLQEIQAKAAAREKAAADAEAAKGSAADPAPAKSDAPVPEEAAAVAKPTKPSVFTIAGADAWAAASERGWRFFPRGVVGRRDGNGSVAQMHPGLNTSSVQGPRMSQLRTLPQWTVISQNVFYMFADSDGRPKPMAAGWKVREVEVRGRNWEWVSQPRAGATSPFFAVKITGMQSVEDSVAELTRLVLEGPPNAKDWRSAFAGSN